ncbi:MAG TPA: hypothetical protein DEB46_05410 [Myxococcales bacterium]|nr:hypothetical protein [Myxococcales bacterium]
MKHLSSLLLLAPFIACDCAGTGEHDAGPIVEEVDSGTPYAPGPDSLIDHRLWIFHGVAPGDPWSDVLEGEEPPACPDFAYGIYDGLWDVDTGFCDYQTFRQDTLLDLSPGDGIQIEMWHLQLWAPQDAMATVGLAIEGHPVWEVEIAIPNDYQFYNPLLRVDRFIPAGTTLYYHVHNHGLNTYRLLDIRKVTPDDDAGFWSWPEAGVLDGGAPDRPSTDLGPADVSDASVSDAGNLTCAVPSDCWDAQWPWDLRQPSPPEGSCGGRFDCVDNQCVATCDEQLCGDYRCDPHLGETTNSCPMDCRLFGRCLGSLAWPVGDCDDFLGTRWTGTGCEPVYGCACEGPECEQLYQAESEITCAHHYCGHQRCCPYDGGMDHHGPDGG